MWCDVVIEQIRGWAKAFSDRYQDLNHELRSIHSAVSHGHGT